MKVLNIHQRTVAQPLEEIAALLETLATKQDKIWPKEHWPKMKLDKGLTVGSTGGHGPIAYVVKQYLPNSLVTFEFLAPKGFSGIHQFELKALGEQHTEIKHVIDMKLSGLGLISWPVAIRWLHDALIEDAFDKIENQFSTEQKKTPWNLWVKILRRLLG